MASFRDSLAKLFSRHLVITKVPGNQLKIFDVNLHQMAEKERTVYSRGRWKRNTYRESVFVGTIEDVEAYRRQLYRDYELMDRDAIVSSALDIYADESTVKDHAGNVLTIKTSDEQIKKILYNLFYDVLNIEFNIFSWVRNTCKYGDYFLILDIRERYGVVNVAPYHPLALHREEDLDGDGKTKFSFSEDMIEQEVFGSVRKDFEEYEVAHFRLLTDTIYLPYGRSILEPGRKTYKQLMLLEDAMMLQRIMRAPERRLFKIDIGNIAPEEIDGYIQDIADSMKKVPYVDERTGDYNLKFNIQNMLEDYFLPVRGSESGTSIETLPGLSGGDQLADINHILGKFFASFKIPKAWLGYEEGVDGKATLASMDIRFARTVERVQKMFVSELYKIAIIHLFLQGVDREKLLDFELELPNPSIIFKRQQVELLNEKMTLATSMLDKSLFSRRHIYETLFDMSEEEFIAMQDEIVEDLKSEFRFEQIKSEGNDPKITGKTFGTTHDIASMQLASKIQSNGADVKTMFTTQPDGREDNPGRPEEPGSFESDKDVDFGRDPTGKKSAEGAKNTEYSINLDHIMKNRKDVEKSLSIKANKELDMLNEHRLMDIDDI